MAEEIMEKHLREHRAWGVKIVVAPVSGAILVDVRTPAGEHFRITPESARTVGCLLIHAATEAAMQQQ